MEKIEPLEELNPPEPLIATHDLGAFDSGVPALDTWLKRRALSNEMAGASRTFVVSQDRRVFGYYSLVAASILHSHATGQAKRNMPDPVPAILIGRLALDKTLHGKGLGTDLLQDAALRCVGAAETIGVRVILVHAISEDAKRFYEHFGFRASPIEPMTLMLTIDEARREIAALNV